jgi:hypothetical protein
MLLAIDTSAGTAVALVATDGRVLAEQATPDTRRHAEVIGPFLADVLSAAGDEPLTGVVTGPAAWLLSVVYLGPVIYIALLTSMLLVRSSGQRFADRATFAAVIAVMHFSWGAGFVWGAALGARDAVDTSRIES